MPVLLALTGTVFLAAQGFSAYLPTVGPAPLRFRPTAPRVAFRVWEPPAVTPAANPWVAAAAPVVPVASTNAVLAVSTNSFTLAPEEPIVSISPMPALPSPAALPPLDPVTPQMMLEYFQQTGPGSQPIRPLCLPMMFVPPVPMTRPDSSSGLNAPADP